MFYGMEVPVDTTSAKLQEFASKAERDAWIKEAVYKDLGVIRCATNPADWEQFDDFLKDFMKNRPRREWRMNDEEPTDPKRTEGI